MTRWGDKRCKKFTGRLTAPQRVKSNSLQYIKSPRSGEKILGSKKVPTVPTVFWEILWFPRFFGSHGFKNLNATLVAFQNTNFFLKSVNFPKSYSQSKFAAKPKIGLWGPRFIAVYQPPPKDTTKGTVLALDQQCRKFCVTLFYIKFSTPEFVIQYGTLVYNC